ASDEASASVSTVAAATEELASSIAEIGRQVTHSSSVADSAVVKAEQTTEMVASLTAAGEKIADVLRLIGAIAEQTNLLALNATGASQSADQSRALAENVLAASGQLSQHTTTLFESVDTFLALLRSAA